MSRVQLAVQRLAKEYPLHAGILARWQIDADESVGTMGVGFIHGKLRLIFNPEFVASIRIDELEGVLHHEINHVLFDHVLHEPEPDEDRNARTIAQEVTVNEWVPEPLPGLPVLLDQYPRLPPNEDTETRYKRLRKKPDKGGDSGKGGGPGKGRKSRRKSPPPATTVDNHDTWREIRENADEASESLKQDIAVVWAALGADQRASLEEAFKAVVNSGCESLGLAGISPGNADTALAGGNAHIPWQKLLRRYAGKCRSRRPVFNRPPRRFPHLTGILPGKGRISGKPRVMAVIDTSGSMDDSTLADVSHELGLMARSFEVFVVECDVVIHAVYPWRPIQKVRGRGGTSFLPPFEKAFLDQHRPDLVVYFTDGYGEAPPNPPSVPVIWCITACGIKPATWGREILMAPPELNR